MKFKSYKHYNFTMSNPHRQSLVLLLEANSEMQLWKKEATEVGHWWVMPIILATWEAEIARIGV
jgi:hypothetical protein